jgi:hypothetical protein
MRFQEFAEVGAGEFLVVHDDCGEGVICGLHYVRRSVSRDPSRDPMIQINRSRAYFFV